MGDPEQGSLTAAAAATSPLLYLEFQTTMHTGEDPVVVPQQFYYAPYSYIFLTCYMVSWSTTVVVAREGRYYVARVRERWIGSVRTVWVTLSIYHVMIFISSRCR